MNKVCIVIPIYKEFPTDWERASFCSALKVLTNYDMVIYTHKELNLEIYHNLARQFDKDLRVECFDKNYFSSVIGYNRLCLTVDFYKRVSTYEYMLIYQLDAWVFRDELEYWCNKGYDYIGAPFFTGFGTHESGAELWAVGNGGFSLRKISFILTVLKYEHKISSRVDFKNGFMGMIKSGLKSLGIRNTIAYYVNRVYDHINEDYFFSDYIPRKTDREILKPYLPKPEEAARFAFECSPSYLYKLCGEKLPFGCHAFEKYEFDTFWKKHITR